MGAGPVLSRNTSLLEWIFSRGPSFVFSNGFNIPDFILCFDFGGLRIFLTTWHA